MTPITLTYDQAKAELEAIVAEKGADYIYERPVDSQSCVYFHAGEPSCIIGHLLARHDVRVPEDQRVNRTSVGELAEQYGVLEPADEAARVLLREVQEYQDNGDTWGIALEAALDYVYEQGLVSTVNHSDYPHHPGYLMDCPACEARCHCTEGSAQCVFDGEHNGSAS